jgi:hypothetical protein
MIAHARVPDRFSAAGPAGQRRVVLPAFNVCGARCFRERGSPGSIHHWKGKSESLTSSLSLRSLCFLLSLRPRALPTSLLFASFLNHRLPRSQLSPAMAAPRPKVVLEPHPWPRSTVTPFTLNKLVNGGLLASVGEGAYPAWMVPPASDMEPNPPYGYVVSFVRLHERGFTAPANRFMRGLCVDG